MHCTDRGLRAAPLLASEIFENHCKMVKKLDWINYRHKTGFLPGFFKGGNVLLWKFLLLC